MRRLGFLLAVVAAATFGCGEKGGGGGELLATIGSRRITQDDLERRLGEMPANVQRQFDGEEGRKNLLDGMLDEEAFLLAAMDANLDETPDVKAQLESARRRVLIQAYYQREVLPYTVMSEEDMLGYYEEHPEEFTRPEESEVVQVVAKTKADAEKARSLLLAGTPWKTVVERYCVDIPTKNREGRIGPVAKDASIIPYVGTSAELGEMIDTITVGKISPVVATGRGFHVLTVEGRTPAALVPFDKVKETIRRNYTPAFSEKIRKEKVGLLKEKYGAKIVQQPVPVKPAEGEGDAERPASKLFELAQSTTDPLSRIRYYDEIVRNHPDDPFACQAQFMIGFVYSEEMHDFDKARVSFERVLNASKGCSDELRKNAKWMLDNMGSEPPEFKD
jgi:peptidyl-prolyl cis-trans isomerase C